MLLFIVICEFHTTISSDCLYLEHSDVHKMYSKFFKQSNLIELSIYDLYVDKIFVFNAAFL